MSPPGAMAPTKGKVTTPTKRIALKNAGAASPPPGSSAGSMVAAAGGFNSHHDNIVKTAQTNILDTPPFKGTQDKDALCFKHRRCP